MLKNSVKKLLRNSYPFNEFLTSFYYLIKNPIATFKKDIRSTLNFKIINIHSYRNTFFGYYDISPFNAIDDNLILFHANNASPLRIPNKTKTDIILYDLKDNKYKKIGETSAWNWQQGSRLTWLDNSKIIYNDFDLNEKRFVSIVLDIEKDIKKKINIPVQSTYRNEYLISIDYSKLFRLKSEYRYPYFENNYDQDKVYCHYFKNSTQQELFSLSDIFSNFKLNKQSNINNTFINHVLISPNGQNFIFFVRTKIKGKRYDYLFNFNFLKKQLSKLIEKAVLSHAVWVSNKNFLIWMIKDEIPGYYFYDLEFQTIDLKYQTTMDGHPYNLGNNIIVSDTYPNKNLRQKLFSLDFEHGIEKEIANIYHKSNFNTEVRCDLHPSVSKSGKYIQVDSLSRKKREIIIFIND